MPSHPGEAPRPRPAEILGAMAPERCRDVEAVPQAVGLRHEHGDALPGRFGGRVPEHLLRRGIDRLNNPLGVDDDDAVEGGADNGTQALLAHAQGIPHFLARRDVGLHPIPYDAAVRHSLRAGLQAHPAKFAVRPPHRNFHLEVGKLAGASPLALPARRADIGQHLPVKRTGIAKRVLDLNAVQLLDARAQVIESGACRQPRARNGKRRCRAGCPPDA